MHDDQPQIPLLQEDSATFIWYGPEAPCLVGDFNQWDAARTPVLIGLTQKSGLQPFNFLRMLMWSTHSKFPAKKKSTL